MRKQLIGKAVSAFMTGVIAVGSTAPAILSPYSAFAGQQLGQTDFDEGVGLPWHICESAPGEMDFEIDNGVYKITIVNPGGASQGGEDRWDCQFRHRGLKIVSGHQYKVSYEITASNSGKFYTKIGNLDGDVEIWHNMSTGDGDFNNTWDPIQINANETKKVEVTFTPSQSMEVAEWAFHLGGDGQYTPGGCFPAGTVITFDNMSLIDLSSDENDYVHPEEEQRHFVLTNQVGYFVGRAKRATFVSEDTKSNFTFDVIDENGESVYSGKAQKFGYDKDSDDNVYILDFSDLDDEGTYHIETSDGNVSREFAIGGSSVYSSMLYDSLNYFYQNRSGIDIEASLITSGDANALARKAGHPKDMAEIEHTWGYSGSSGSIDVTGGWYDAGDHGKYVVNGGFSLWMMQNQYETAVKYGFEDKYADGTMNIPENTNSYPDLLDEARWEMDWMFSMIVDSGEYKDMVYHKAHDEKWTALGIAPADDDMKRIVKPPTTAATLNFAACAAQSARLWKGIDDSFSQKCLDAAEKCYEAAKKHPSMYAPLDESVGGGAYGDDDVTDEFYWAATELFITTGNEDYYDDIQESKFFLDVPTSLGGGESVDTIGSMDWGNTAACGTLSAALNTKSFDKGDAEIITDAVTSAADYYIDLENEQGYGLPYGASKLAYNDSDEGYVWGSNSFVTDNSIVMAFAYLLTDDDKYMDGVIGGMDYILGRNPMDYSYVTGYGSHTTEYPHHRYWSKLIDDAFPKAPCGVMAGGPNSGMQDPWVQGSGWKKGQIAPQKCYLDHIEAWCVNECTINWNASLAWVTGFLAEENGGIVVGETGCSAGIVNDTAKDESAAKVTTSKTEKSGRTVTTAKAKASKADDDSEKGSSGVWIAIAVIVAVVMFAGVVIAIALMIFIYKMVKLRSENGGKLPKSDEKKKD
ncbi:Carbohydrate binding domain-containing protein [Ruminococcus sp. YRD2003]|uniref:glycoside hydrolase family 9 protein n=1 Tax=Ruminococcus sp. YRD2003 TaxID=1452313 RepID=UPI0008B5B40D|nr:Carbohydrate binding domain-containing protein [Ruminococcus flavefaciens]